jgi:hypothetical protein
MEKAIRRMFLKIAVVASAVGAGGKYVLQYLRAGLNKSINKGHKKKILAFSLF